MPWDPKFRWINQELQWKSIKEEKPLTGVWASFGKPYICLGDPIVPDNKLPALNRDELSRAEGAKLHRVMLVLVLAMARQSLPFIKTQVCQSPLLALKGMNCLWYLVGAGCCWLDHRSSNRRRELLFCVTPTVPSVTAHTDQAVDC
eukprot:1157560-Pelagomonas_calceolata.AAC.3